MYVFTCMIDFVGVAWVWSSLSELLAYPNGSRFPLGQRGSDNRGWTVMLVVTVHHFGAEHQGGGALAIIIAII